MDKQNFRKRFHVRCLQVLCMIIMLLAIPGQGWAKITYQKSSGVINSMDLEKEEVGLDNPVITIKMPLAVNCNERDGYNCWAFKDFNLYLKDSNGREVVIASMSKLGLAAASFKHMLPAGYMFDGSVWLDHSFSTVYWGIDSHSTGIPTTYGTQSGAVAITKVEADTESWLYLATITIVPERLNILSSTNSSTGITTHYVAVGFKGTIFNGRGDTSNSGCEYGIPSDIDDSKLSFVRSNRTVSYKGTFAKNDKFKYVVDLYDSDPTVSEDPLTPVYTSNVSDLGETSLDLHFDDYKVDNLKPVTLYPVVRYIRNGKPEEIEIGNFYNNAFEEQILHYVGPVVLPGFAYAKNVNVEYADDYKKWMKVTWEADGKGEYSKNGKWYVYRQDADDPTAEIECLGNTSNFDKMEYVDENKGNHLDFGKEYIYTVCFIPEGWDSRSYKNAEGLYCQKQVKLNPTFTFGTVTGDTPEIYTTSEKNKNEIMLHWGMSAIGDAATKTYRMYVDRTTAPEDAASWENLGTIDVNSATLTSGVYVDRKGLELYETYYYRLRINVQNADFTSTPVTGSLTGGSEVTGITASRGTYTSVVKLKWEVNQVGSNKSFFVLSRRPLGSTNESEYSDIYTTSGTDDMYSYDDATARPGSYYEYRIRIYALYKGEQKGSMSVITDGYCIQTGVLSGRVYYGTGTAVEGAKVLLKPNDSDGETLNKYRAVNLTDPESSITYAPGYDKMSALLGKDFSMQMYVNPVAGTDEQSLIVLPKMMNVTLKPATLEGRQVYEVAYTTGTGAGSTGLGVYVKPGEWSCLTLAYNRKAQTLNAYIVDYKDGTKETRMHVSQTASGIVLNLVEPEADGTGGTQAISIADACGEAGHYNGLVDEFRFWTKTLSKADVEKNCFHTLSGSESNLAIYWPMDEGLENQVVAYDLSQTNDVANECHAVATHAKTSENVPDEEMLSLCTLTDKDGNYVLRGVPFSGNGTNYVVSPIFGVHEFSPSSASCFLSGQSTVHSGIDFTDVSSFPVSGVVYYEGTTIPVSGVQLMVDGSLSAKDGKAITTGENGEFTVDVPIGDHFIGLSLNGHTFVNGGRYPADPDGVGARSTFESAMTGLMFYDDTKVVVAGRVAGGDIENAKPLGVGAGKANIGKAVIKLNLNRKDGEFINAKLETDGLSRNFVCNDEPREFTQATARVNSKVFVEGGKNIITVETDPVTGEWAALMPPLKYETQSITIPSQTELDFTGKLGVVDASNAVMEQTDSIESDEPGTDGYIRFKYCSAYKVEYRSASHFDVIQNEDGSFGEKNYEVSTLSGTTDKIDLYNTDADGKVTYPFGHPVFVQYHPYTFKIKAYEQYVNNDGVKPVYDNVPLGNLKVTAKNQMAASTAVFLESGEVYEVEGNEFELDSLGCANYQFSAGLPNLQEPYTRTMAFSYDIDGTELQWDGNSTFQAIVVGMLPKGNNFVTEGPDKPLMILRDPPGSSSTATYAVGKSHSKVSTYTNSVNAGASVNTTTKFGVKLATFVGLGVGVINEAETKLELDVGLEANYTYNHENTKTITTTTTKEISTSDSPDFVGAKGDIYIGTSTNIILGECQDLSIVKDEVNGVYKFRVADILMSSEEFTTSFNYTQDYILTKLIPNLTGQRDNLLQFVSNVHNVARPAKGKDPIYVTELTPEDDNYGTSNNDKAAWGSRAVEFGGTNLFETGRWDGPSYSVILPLDCENDKDFNFSDRIQYFNSQVKGWQNIIRQNEKAKVEAIRGAGKHDNYSFDGGASITVSVENDTTKSIMDTNGFELNLASAQRFGTEVSGTGVDFEIQEHANEAASWGDGEDDSNTTAFTYTLADDSNNDYLTVDVYSEGIDGFSPIFYTRAGATSGPYEDEVVTEFYEPGTVIMQKTLQVEKPELEILDPIITGVPSGKDATFRIRMHNNSETKANLNYGIRVVASSNPNGAQVYLDGKNITEGVQIFIPGGESVTKTLQLRQTVLDTLEYKDITLHMYALTQPDDIFSDQSLNVSFQPSCTDIDLAVTTSVVNTESDAPVTFSMSGYDYNQASFQEIRLQYKGENDANFKNLQVFVKDKARVDADPNLKLFTALSGTEKLTRQVDLRSSDYTDQTYVFRAVTVGIRGGDEVTSQSEEIRIVRDMSRPQLITNPTPVSGILTAGGNITLTFNEDIASNVLTKTNNFIVTGMMNESEVAHDVALALNPTGVARTQADIDLSGRSFAADFWLNCSTDGTVFQHGTSGNSFTVSIREGKLVIAVGGQEAVSTKTLPKDKWLFVAFNYDCSGNEPTVSASYAQDADIVSLITSVVMPAYNAAGPITLGGNGLVAHMQEVSLWTGVRSISDALVERNRTKNPYTSGLIGYWQLNEGHGVTATDAARRRDLTLPAQNAWWTNSGTNYAVKLDGKTAVEAPVSSTAGTDDSYMVELWFNATGKTSGNQTIISFGKYADVSLNASGQAVVTIDGTSTISTTASYADGQWHHLAMNVLKGSNGSATLYLDGVACRQFSASSMPSLGAAAHLVIGARELADGSYSQYLTGYADELRAWNGHRTAETVKSMMYQRVEEDTEGLDGYYPMELRSLDEYGQVVTTTCSTERASGGVSSLAMNVKGGTVQFAAESPSLTSAPALENVQFSYVASERQITISLNEQASKIENCNVNLTVKNVKDLNGNLSQPITWTVFVRQNQLQWVDSEVCMEMVNGQSETFTVEIENAGATSDSWALSGLPTWLSVNNASGTLAPQASQKLRFTIDGSTAVGSYETTVYLTGSQNIKAPLTISLKVKGEEPDWTPVTDEETMILVGQIRVNGIISSNPDDMIAAFRGQECVGVAHPIYISRFDAYFITMNIYGNGDTEGCALTYKYYDAGTGVTYPSVSADKKEVFTYNSSKIVGTFTDWVILEPENRIEQDLSMTRSGWKWFSMYVTPSSCSLDSVFAHAGGAAVTIKDAESTSVYSGGSWGGSLTELGLTTMYKLHAVESFDESTIGVPANPSEIDMVLNPDWNWIGYPVSATNSLTAAFADADPEEGDIVIGQSSFAIFTDGDWIGSLIGMVPGDGYKYFSNDTQSKTFNFQKPSGDKSGRMLAAPMRQNGTSLQITSQYNMSVVAQVTMGGRAVSGAVVSVYDGNTLCGTSWDEKRGLHFLTVGDMGLTGRMTVVVEVYGRTYRLNGALSFQADAVLGSVMSPYILSLDNATAIESYSTSIERIELYSANGILVSVVERPDRLLSSDELNEGDIVLQRVVYSDGTVNVIKTASY